MTKNVIIYGNFSHEAQIGKATSVSEQIDDCTRYAKKRRWKIAHVWVDVHERPEYLPALHRMIADSVAGTKPWDIILVHDLAQISRDAHLFEFHRRILLVHGITIHSFAEQSVSGTMADLAAPIEAFVNRYQREFRGDASGKRRRAIARRDSKASTSSGTDGRGPPTG